MLTVKIQQSLGSKATFKDFRAKLYGDADIVAKVIALRTEVTSFARRFRIPGLKYL